jgi:Leucine-rich repeat (LRR) protein
MSGLPASLTQLTIGDFEGLTSIASNTFKPLPLLERLSLNKNSIKTIKPGAFNQLNKLTRLELKGNNLTDFSFNLLSTNIHLKVLDLSENKLSCIPKRPVSDNTLSLVDLNLSENNIRSADLEELDHLLNLRSLSVAGNCFDKFDLEGIIHSKPYLLDFNLGRLCNFSYKSPNSSQEEDEETEIKAKRRKEALKCRRNRVAVSTRIRLWPERHYLDKLVNEGIISVIELSDA